MQSESSLLKHKIPWLLAGARAVLGPAMVVGERAGWSGTTLAAMVITALLSDIFDGVLARRWRCDTAAVRLFDSMADIVFYLGCAAALWMRHPALVRALAVPIAAVVGLEALCLAIAFIKFSQTAQLSLLPFENLGTGAGVRAGHCISGQASRDLDLRRARFRSPLESRRNHHVADPAGMEARREVPGRRMADTRNRTAARVRISRPACRHSRTRLCNLCSSAARSKIW